MSAFFALIRKDLRIYASDRRAVIMSIVAPITIASFFGFLFGGGGSTETSKIPVLAVDQDGSAISREIVARVASDKALNVQPSDAVAARESVHKGKTTVAFIIPAGFGADAASAFFSSREKPKIDVLYDPSHRTEFSMFQGMLAGHVMESVSKEMFSGPSGQQAIGETLSKLDTFALSADDKQRLRALLQSVERYSAGRAGTAAPAAISMPFQVNAEEVTSGNGIKYSGYAHSFGGMGIQFILFFGIDVGINLLLQRQRGVWKRLRAAPLSRGVLLGSRAASAAMISMFVLMLLFGFARVVFGVHIQGSMAGFLGVCAAFSLMTAAFGLLVATLGKTPDATRGLSILATLLLLMLGGAWIPTFVFPQWMQNLTVVIPTRWAMDGLDAMTWRGLAFSSAIQPIGLLLLAAAICGAAAVLRFRWEAEG